MKEKEKFYTYLGIFFDTIKEEDFQLSQYRKTRNLIQSSYLFFGILFASFLLVDYFFLKDFFSYLIVSFSRILFLGLSIYLYQYRTPPDNPSSLKKQFTYYLSFGIFSTLLIIYMYQVFHFTPIAFAILLFILSIFFFSPLTTGRKNLLSLVLVLGFILISLLKDMTLQIEVSSFFFFVSISLFFFNSLIANYNFIERENYEKENKLAILIKKDPLTGIPNRLRFNEILEYHIRFATRYKTPLILVLIQFQGLRSINNRYGQEAGDMALKEFAEIIQKNIRETDFLARVGGDEFTLLLPNTRKESSTTIIARLHEKIKEHFSSKERPVDILTGVASYEEEDTFISFIKKADTSLFDNKKRKK